MFNKKIRTYAKEKNVHLWQIADELNITDGNFSRKLRRELPEKEQKGIIQIIDRIKKRKGINDYGKFKK